MTDDGRDSDSAEAGVMLDEASRLAWEAHEHEAAIRVWDGVVEQWGASTDPVLRWCVKAALYKKGLLLIELRRRAEAVTVYEQLVRRHAVGRNRYLVGAAAHAAAAAVTLGVALRLQEPFGRLMGRVWGWLPEEHPAKRLPE
jgi:hypothetical protein